MIEVALINMMQISETTEPWNNHEQEKLDDIHVMRFSYEVAIKSEAGVWGYSLQGIQGTDSKNKDNKFSNERCDNRNDQYFGGWVITLMANHFRISSDKSKLKRSKVGQIVK